MYLNPLNWALVLCSLIGLIDNVLPTANYPNYPGVIELVGYNDRKARTHYIPPDELQHQSKSKMAADIETVKQNIEKYNKLLKMDTKNLPDSQKEILERIVERVARLKESIDINQEEQQDNSTKTSSNESGASASAAVATESQETTLSDSLATSSESASAYSSSASSSIEDTTKNLDATTISDSSQMMSTAVEDIDDYSMVTNQDINASEEISAGAVAKEMDTITGEEDESSNIHDDISSDLNDANATADSEDDDDGEIPTSTTIGSDGEMDEDQFVAARSNNNNHRTLVSTSKTKSRPNSTKRPGQQSSPSSSSSSTLTKLSTSSIKRVNGQKPSSMVGSSMKPTTTTSTSFATSSSSITTVQPMVKIQKPSSSSTTTQSKEPSETMMKVQHQLPQKQQQQQQLNKVQAYQQQQEQEAAAAAAAASSLAALQQQQQIQIEQKTMSTPPTLQQQQQQQAASAIQIQQRTPIGGTIGSSSSGSSITNTAGSSLSSDMLYDSNVNTSSIIDSLNNAREEFYNKAGISNKDKKTSATAKPTKYHYYPHNQHIYLLPECAIQQVCNAVYVRLNYTQPLCACPSRYRDPCSASLNEDDQHTTKLVGDGKKKAITLAKTCETITEMRECRSPKDWSLLALQNTRTGKSHYLVICRCPDHFKMEGPMAHDQPTYASVPGIRVFGMMCVKPGFQVRKPSVQPPKRYQLQKPYYIPNSQNKYSSIKDHSRPSYGSSSLGGSSSLNYQPPPQHHTLHQQDTYQYLNRPESSSTLFVSSSNNHGHNNHNDYPESISFNGGIYGRNNERNGEKPIPAAEEDMTSTSSSSSSSSNSDNDSPPSSSSISPISSETKSEEISRTSSAELDESPTTLEAVASKRDKRSVDDFELENYENASDEDDSAPEFPWQRAIAFQRSIVWD